MITSRPARQSRLPAVRPNLTEGTAHHGGDGRRLQRHHRPHRAAERRQLPPGRRSCCARTAACGIPKHPYSCSVATTNVADRVVEPGAARDRRTRRRLRHGRDRADHPGRHGRDLGPRPAPRRCAVRQPDLPRLHRRRGRAGLRWVPVDHPRRQRRHVPRQRRGRRAAPPDVRQPPLPCRTRRAPGGFAARRRRSSSSARSTAARWRCCTPPTGRSTRRRARAVAARRPRPSKRGATARSLICPSCHGVTLGPSERIVSYRPAAAGYGPPVQRDPARVKHDLEEGWITRGARGGLWRRARGRGRDRPGGVARQTRSARGSVVADRRAFPVLLAVKATQVADQRVSIGSPPPSCRPWP